MKYFETRFLKEAEDFIRTLDQKSRAKIFYNIDLAEQTNDPRLFKKLKDEIWEFRSKYMGKAIRELIRTFVAGGIAAATTQVHQNLDNFEVFICIIPLLRFISKYLHERFPGRIWDWLPF